MHWLFFSPYDVFFSIAAVFPSLCPTVIHRELWVLMRRPQFSNFSVIVAYKLNSSYVFLKLGYKESGAGLQDSLHWNSKASHVQAGRGNVSSPERAGGRHQTSGVCLSTNLQFTWIKKQKPYTS